MTHEPAPPIPPSVGEARGRALPHVLFMTAGMASARVFGVVSTFLVANLLGREGMGVWGVLRLIYVYGGISHLGVLEAYRKEVPRLRSAGEDVEAGRVESLALGMALLSSTLVTLLSILVVAAARVFRSQSSLAVHSLSILAMFLSVFGGILGTLFFDRFTIRHFFEQASILRGLRGTVYLVFLPLGAWLGGVTGAALGFAASEWAVTFAAVVLARGKCPPVLPQVDVKRLAQLIAIGLPITLVWTAYLLESTFDRIVTMSLLGSAQTGLYFMGVTLASVIQMLPEALSRVFNPRLNERMGASSDPSEVAALVWRPARTLAWILPLATGMVAICLDPLYRTLLPDFVPGVESARILVLGALMPALLYLGIDFMVAINEQRKLLVVIPASIAFNLIGNWSVVKLGFGIEGVAAITVLTNALVALYLWARAGSCLEDQGRWRTLLLLGAGWGASAALVAAYTALAGTRAPGWGPALIGGGLFALVYVMALLSFPTSRHWVREDLAQILSFGRGLARPGSSR
ncbi:MAG: hypothetical protein GHCLOJNM_03200 [bacterium]|nr:hypothetical protein [bacterium]